MKRSLFFAMAMMTIFKAQALSNTPWSAGISKGEDLIIKLVTIEPGDELYTWWGHSAIIVEDVRHGLSILYNYGIFSFEADSFYRNFVMGRLYFQIQATAAGRELDFYRRVNRTIRTQTLDLPPDRRVEMAKFLDWNALPENRVYLYHHYSDNCATRVRDVIDKMVDGRLAAATDGPARLSLRQHTRRYTFRHFFMDWLLMFLMGKSIDRPIKVWDEMFLPGELEHQVGQLLIPDEQGGLKPLVRERAVFYRAESRAPVPDKAPPAWPWGLAIGLPLGLMAVIIGLWMRRGGPAGRLAFGLYHALVGLLYGVPGSVLLFMSLFTDHDVTYGNQNLFLANPAVLSVLPWGIVLILGKALSRPALFLTWTALAAVGLLSLLLKLLPGFNQQNWISVSAILPVTLAFACSWLIIRKPGRHVLSAASTRTSEKPVY
ncbi:MAG: DUF4105 domain-containing protein [Spirochaetota bacterium]